MKAQGNATPVRIVQQRVDDGLEITRANREQVGWIHGLVGKHQQIVVQLRYLEIGALAPDKTESETVLFAGQLGVIENGLHPVAVFQRNGCKGNHKSSSK